MQLFYIKKCLSVAQQYWKEIEVEINNKSENNDDKNLGALDLDLDQL
ncbi:5200_t:CDS:1, partial [Gigaspora rosea]